jgi:hypothetical protein
MRIWSGQCSPGMSLGQQVVMLSASAYAHFSLSGGCSVLIKCTPCATVWQIAMAMPVRCVHCLLAQLCRICLMHRHLLFSFPLFIIDVSHRNASLRALTRHICILIATQHGFALPRAPVARGLNLCMGTQSQLCGCPLCTAVFICAELISDREPSARCDGRLAMSSQCRDVELVNLRRQAW